jgi:hypothetical protein
MNENHEGQAPLVPGADGIAATAICGRETPAAVGLGRPSAGAFANEADLSSEMGPRDLDSKRRMPRMKYEETIIFSGRPVAGKTALDWSFVGARIRITKDETEAPIE